MTRDYIEVVRLTKLTNAGKTKAFAVVRIGCVCVTNLRLIEGENGLFVAMPEKKSGDVYFKTVYISGENRDETKQICNKIAEKVIEAYKK